MSIKLKSCPLCGSKPYTIVEPRNTRYIDLKICCDNPTCGLTLKGSIEDDSLITFRDVEDGMKAMEDAWNRRAGNAKIR